jgi:hypothetical protein
MEVSPVRNLGSRKYDFLNRVVGSLARGKDHCDAAEVALRRGTRLARIEDDANGHRPFLRLIGQPVE